MNHTERANAAPGAFNSGEPMLAAGRLFVDPQSQTVRLDRTELALKGRVYALLIALMSRPCALISKDTLIDEVWEGRAVSDAVLTTAIRDLRLALSDNARRPVWIKTEHGRGYRFIAKVVSASDASHNAPVQDEAPVMPAEPAQRSQAGASTSRTQLYRWAVAALAVIFIGVLGAQLWLAQPASPNQGGVDRSVAVLGFETVSSEEQEAWFAEGLSEELTNALARVPDLRVASRNATRAAAEADPSPQGVASTLGVAHFVEGAVRIADDQVRVTVSLVSAEDGRQLWSQRFDQELSDILSLQADIASYVASTLETSFNPAALRKMSAAGTESIAAFEAYLRARAKMAEYERTGLRSLWQEALDLLDRARSIDPSFAEAHATSAVVYRYLNTPSLLMQETPTSSDDYMRQFAARLDSAIRFARDDAEAAAYRAMRDTELFALDSARQAFETYLAARPNDIVHAFEYISVLVMLGDHEAARATTRRLEAVIPHRDATNRALLIQAGLRARDFEFAAEIAQQTLSDHPFHGFTLVSSHWAFLRVGDVDAARDAAQRIETSKVSQIAQSSIWINQLCADGDRAGAEGLWAGLEDDSNIPISAWHALRALGDDEAAYAQLAKFDRPGSPSTRLRGLLRDEPSFDPSHFPHLSQAIASAGGRLVEPEAALVRCVPSA